MDYAKIAYSKVCDVEKYLQASAQKAELFPFQAQCVTKNFVDTYCLETYRGHVCSFTGEVGSRVTALTQLRFTCQENVDLTITIFCNNVQTKQQVWHIASNGGGVFLQNVFTLSQQKNDVTLIITGSAPFTVVGFETTVLGKCALTVQSAQPQGVVCEDGSYIVTVHESDQTFFYNLEPQETTVHIEEYVKKMAFLQTKLVVLQNSIYVYGLNAAGDLYRVSYESGNMCLLMQNVSLFDVCLFSDKGFSYACVVFVKNDVPQYIEDNFSILEPQAKTLPFSLRGFTDVCVFASSQEIYFFVVSNQIAYVCVATTEEGISASTALQISMQCSWRGEDNEFTE